MLTTTFSTAPTPFVAFPYVYVFSGTVNDAGRCMGTSPLESNQASITSFTEYDVSSVAMSWFRLASYEPIGWVQSYAAYANFQLSTAYISVYSTTPGEWYTSAAGIKLEEPFITWLAHDPVALSAVPKIMSCSPVSGAGAPNVHVRVSLLTTSSAVTSTTNAIFIDKATTTSAVPASQPPPAGPISTTPPTIQTTEATQIPSKQPSGQPHQPTGQTSDQPNPSPSNPPTETSQKPGSPSQGPNDSPPTTPEISLNKPNEQPTFTSDTSNQPATQKPTGDSPAALIQSSDQAVYVGDQTSADLVQITSAGNQASNLPGSRPVNSQAATQETNTDDTVQNTAVLTGKSPTETSQGPPPVAIGDVTASQASNGYIVGSQTLTFGGSAIEVSGTTYSLQASGGTAQVNGQDVQVSTLAPPIESAVPIVLGDSTGRPASSGAYVMADQTLSRGGSAIEISGTTSLGPSGDRILVNGQATPVSALQATLAQPATVVIGGVTAVPESSGAYYVVAGQTLSPGASAIEISSVTYSLPNSGANIVVNGATSYVNAASTPASVVLGSITAASFIGGGYIVFSQILSPGGTEIEVSGTTYSLAASGNTVFVDGKPTTFQNVAAAAPLTIGSQTFTAIAASRTPLVLASQTLVPGGSAITVSGTTYSHPPSVTDSIVVDGQTKSLAQASGIAILSADSQQISFTPLNSGIVVASQTLYPGEAVTIDGETLSLASSGGVVIVKSGESTTTEGLGDYIWQGIATSTSALRTDSAARSTETTGSSTRNGSRPSASTTTGSRTAGTESGNEAAAATTTASQANRNNVDIVRWLSVMMCLAMAVLVVW